MVEAVSSSIQKSWESAVSACLRYSFATEILWLGYPVVAHTKSFQYIVTQRCGPAGLPMTCFYGVPFSVTNMSKQPAALRDVHPQLKTVQLADNAAANWLRQRTSTTFTDSVRASKRKHLLAT